ncbi:MAG: CSLREA domain-containing protein [Anaerolineales bacterium]|nr:CSLREA domain-containing protein [Anaerolineales bacterium]
MPVQESPLHSFPPRCRHSGFLLVLSLALLALGLLLTQLPTGPALAQDLAPTPTMNTIVVTTLEDENKKDGDCSLREAIEAANSDFGQDACPAGNGLDKIDLTGLQGTIELNSQLVVISKVVISGPGAARLVLSGGGENRIFILTPNAHVLLSDISIADGYAQYGDGGGIFNEGVLSLLRCQFYDNASRASGGALANTGRLAVGDSTFYANRADLNGGALYNIDGEVRVTSSTFSGNRASLNADLANYGGGALSNLQVEMTATLSIQHSTITGNSAKWGGGVSNSAGDLAISHSILAGNSVLAGGQGPNCHSMSAITGSYNLESGRDCGFTGAGDLQNADPHLGPLRANGGQTLTHALLRGSAAIDQGDPLFAPPPANDQRGPIYPRLVAGRIDIGAFEAWYQLFLPVTH